MRGLARLLVAVLLVMLTPGVADGQTVSIGGISLVCSGGFCQFPQLRVKPDSFPVVTVRVDTVRPPVLPARVDTLYCSAAGLCSPTRPPIVVPPPPPPPPPVVPPPPAPGGSLPPHPRVHMTPARVAFLQAQAIAGTTRWTRVKAGAEAQVAKAAVGPNDVNLLPDLCLAYLATGDARYATRAGVVLTSYAVETNDLKYDSGYGYRFLLPNVYHGLDWCYAGLSVAQRLQAATWLMNRADWAWPQSNPARAGAWGTTNEKNNYYHGFMETGPAALAADGDDTGTGTISGSNRPAYHRALALQKRNGAVASFFTGEGEGGAWSEGTNYDSSWRVGSFDDAFLTAGLPIANTFLPASLLWRFHSTMPGGVYKAPIGKQPRDSRASQFAYDRLHALFAIPASPGVPAGQARAWLDLIGNVATQEFNETAALADELLRYDPAVQPVSLATLPRHYYAKGAGFFVVRQSWSDPASTVLVFEAGPTADAGARNANGLMIWKGDFWVSATANLYSGSGIEIESAHNNNLTVGGVGQYLFPGNGGTMADPQVSDSLVVLRGQAKGGYGYQNQWVNTRFVTDFSRVVVYQPFADVVVVVDRISVKDSTARKVLRWHSKSPAAISGQGFTLASGTHRCAASLAAPSDAVLGTQAFAIGPAGAASSSAVTVTLPLRTSDAVVTVFQCAAGVPASVAAVVNAGQARVTVGARVITIPSDTTQPVTVGP